MVIDLLEELLDPVEYFQQIYLKSYPETVATSIATTNYKYNEKSEMIFSIISSKIHFHCKTFAFAPCKEAYLSFYPRYATQYPLMAA